MENVSDQCLSPLLEELNAVIDDGHFPPTLRQMVEDALRQPGHAFASPPGLKWPLFVLLSCQSSSGGEWRQALPAAAAFELMSASLEIVDDLQDGDVSPLQIKYGDAQALNTAFLLFVLAHRALWRLVRWNVSAEKRIAVAEALSMVATTVGSGQHLDLLYESRPEVSQDECLQAISEKSAGLVSGAFRIGALLGTVGKPLVEKYAELGWHLGMYGQLANDIEDVLPGRIGKSDIRRGKKTLPLVFGLNGANNRSVATSGDEAELRASLWKCGALHYTWVIAEVHRQKAKEIVALLEQVRPAEAILGPLMEAKDGLL